MQKLSLVIFSALMFAACSTSPNNNGGSSTTVVPVAPSNLTGTVLSSSSVSLNWVDNSTNETGFKIERRLNGTAQFSVVGTVNAEITGFTDANLTANTSYEYRVYSFNAVGNSMTYSNVFVITITTAVNLPSVTIGSQIWSSKNLNVAKYKNGDPIPQVTDPATWANLTTGAWCWYANDSVNYGAIYGKLYNWYAVNDIRGLAPNGWHVATNRDWDIMTKYLDSTIDTTCQCFSGATIGTQLKNTSGWYSGGNGTNSSGFIALPGGYRLYNGSFGAVDWFGTWWSSSEYDGVQAWYRNLQFDMNDIYRNHPNKTSGFSIRVVRD